MLWKLFLLCAYYWIGAWPCRESLWQLFVIVPFVWTFIYSKFFQVVPLFNGFIRFVSANVITCIFNLHVRLNLFTVCCLICWSWSRNVTLVNVLDIIRVSFLQGYFISTFFYLWLAGCYLQMFIICQYVYAPIHLKTGLFCIRTFRIAKTLFMLVYSVYYYT